MRRSGVVAVWMVKPARAPDRVERVGLVDRHEEDGDLVFFPALALKKLEALRREGEASWKCDLKLLINIVISSATQN
jgi:hypothetical protein